MRTSTNTFAAALLFPFLLLYEASPAVEKRQVDLSLKVVDAAGASLPSFEAMLHSHQHGYARWQSGTNGAIHFGTGDIQSLLLLDDPSFQLVVRASGFAPVILQLEDNRQPMRQTVTMSAGRLLTLTARTADGRSIPQDVRPLVVFNDFAARVRMEHMPRNIRQAKVEDFVMAPVERIAPGRYQFRIPTNSPPFFLFIDHPAFLRACDSASFAPGQLPDNSIEWVMPAAAKLHVSFTLPANTVPPGYVSSVAALARFAPDEARLYELWRQPFSTVSFATTVSNLPPGLYRFSLALIPEQATNVPTTTAVARTYTDEAMFDLQAGEQQDLELAYSPPKPDAWRDNTALAVTVMRHSGKPAAAESFSLSYVAPHLGEIEILSGKLDTRGRCQLPGVRADASGPEFFFTMGDQFRQRFKVTAPNQQITFTLPPQLKDSAPDCSFMDMRTRKSVSLRSLRGAAVYLEFWATWCGPCQAPLARLDQLSARKRQEWSTNVHVLAVSIDDALETQRCHVERRGWNHVRHVWTGEGGATGLNSPGARAFGISGVPTAVLIDPAGTIVWRGHPKDADCDVQIGKMIPPPKNDGRGQRLSK